MSERMNRDQRAYVEMVKSYISGMTVEQLEEVHEFVIDLLRPPGAEPAVTLPSCTTTL